MIKIVFRYIKKNWIAFLIAGYFLFSSFLKFFSGIDICIPCLWKAFLGFNCPGCGLTTAFIALFSFDLSAAYAANPLIFVVLIAGSYFIVRDFYKFYTESV